MQTLPIRIISALIALLIFVGLYYYLGGLGLQICCGFASFVGALEAHKLVMQKSETFISKWLLAAINMIVFLNFLVNDRLALPIFVVSILVIWSLALWSQRPREEEALRNPNPTYLQKMYTLQSQILICVFYTGILPALAGKLIDLKNGHIWFLAMMGIVFSGDVFAFFFGLLFGKRKILPLISPKKTFIGSFGGILGSIIAGLVFSRWLPHLPLWTLVITSAFAGIIAQHGDFFESLLKRIANAKDSGRIMPGHGGVLDRLDGILFAAPVLLLAASILEGLY